MSLKFGLRVDLFASLSGEGVVLKLSLVAGVTGCSSIIGGALCKSILVLFATCVSTILVALVWIVFLLCLEFQRSVGEIEFVTCLAKGYSFRSGFPFPSSHT